MGLRGEEEEFLTIGYYILFVSPVSYNEKFIQNGLDKQGKFHTEEHSFNKYLDQVVQFSIRSEGLKINHGPLSRK